MWCQNNRLLANQNKTKTMLLTSKRRAAALDDDNLKIYLEDALLENVSQQKILGLCINRFLTWDAQVSNICKKVAVNLNILRKIRHFIPFYVRKMFVSAYILPHIDYCCSIWGNCKKSLLRKVQRLHKQAAYLVVNNNEFQSYAKIVKKLHWMTIGERIFYRKSLLVFKALNGMAPDYLSKMFHYVKDVHSVNLRSTNCDKLYISRPKTGYQKMTFSYDGATAWNKLPNEVTKSAMLLSFKRNCTRYIISLRDNE